MKKYTRSAALCLLCFLLIAQSLCACSAAPQGDRVDDDQLDRLRKQYPISDSTSATANLVAPYDVLYPTFEALLSNGGYCAVAVLKFTGDWYQSSIVSAPYDNKELNDTAKQHNPSSDIVHLPVHNAKVKQLLWGGGSLKVGDTITLSFGSSTYVSGLGLEECFVSGKTYICFLRERDDASRFEGVDRIFTTTKARSFYLTKNDVILSIMGFPGANDCSGMYLPAFTTLVHETLGPPEDALTE